MNEVRVLQVRYLEARCAALEIDRVKTNERVRLLENQMEAVGLLRDRLHEKVERLEKLEKRLEWLEQRCNGFVIRLAGLEEMSSQEVRTKDHCEALGKRPDMMVEAAIREAIRYLREQCNSAGKEEARNLGCLIADLALCLGE